MGMLTTEHTKCILQQLSQEEKEKLRNQEEKEKTSNYWQLALLSA